MIFWGTKFVKRTLETGTFLCPNCTAEQPYTKISGQKHGHLYWIPLFSMGDPIEYVECQQCKSEWQPSVLSYSAAMSPDALSDQYRELLRQVLVSIAAADGILAAEEIEIVQSIYSNFSGGAELAEADIRAAANRLDANSMITSFNTLGQQLSNEGKEYLMKAAILVAYADGHLDDQEATLLGYFSEGLGMSAAHVKGVMADLAGAGTDAA